MEREERFDAFYRATSGGLVHQVYAVTGDLRAALHGVRAAYVAAWHHWRGVSEHPDPLDWVRPRAWQQAQRRQRARRWRRGSPVPDRDRAVLDSAGRLPAPQRRVLVLTELAGLPLLAAARELGLAESETAHLLHSARTTFAVSLDRDPRNIRRHLETLGETAGQANLPRPSVLRRAGGRRRQSHTLLATAAAAAVALGSGVLAYQPEKARAGKVPEEMHRVKPVAPPSAGPADAGGLPSAAQLLDGDQIARLGPTQDWRVTTTGDNTAGTGINTICQQARFADPDGRAALVRSFRAEGGARRSAVQTIEISRSPRQAAKAFDTTVGWYSACQVARLQLLTAYRVTGIGDQARLLMFRVWKRPVTTYSVAVARIGAVTTTTVGKTEGGNPAAPRQTMRSLADSVSMLCGTSGSRGCPQTSPRLARVPPPPSSEERGILAEVDLPPVGHIDHPWVGIKATPANRSNPAATICDQASFAGSGAVKTRTRTFLIPQARRLPARFGLSETYGVFPSQSRARGFAQQMRARMAKCEDKHIAVHVTRGPSAGPGQPGNLTTWLLRTEISRRASVTFRVGFVRVGATVAQLTFSPGGPAQTVSAADFRDVVARAADRLHELG
jgi:DNA-directed RNA polymerase specialized sigma24 family protein